MEQALYYKNKLKHLQQAVSSFAQVVEVDLLKMTSFEQDIYKNAAVQKFEYCIELYWKVAKIYLLLYKGIDESSPKGVLKAFYQESSLQNDEYEHLLQMILHRNLLSHLYDQEQFEKIHTCLKGHAQTFQTAMRAFQDESLV